MFSDWQAEEGHAGKIDLTHISSFAYSIIDRQRAPHLGARPAVRFEGSHNHHPRRKSHIGRRNLLGELYAITAPFAI